MKHAARVRAIVGCWSLLFAIHPTLGRTTPYAMRTFFPNDTQSANHYLLDVSPPGLLWFEYMDSSTFRQYNNPPYKRCHYDQFAWGSDGYMRYVQTVDWCTLGTSTVDSFDPPIVFLPPSWNDAGEAWSTSGSVTQSHFVNGVLTCQGTNTYTNTILGWELIAPGQWAIHWRTNQTICWTLGSCGNCTNWKTHWEEDWFFITNLPLEEGGTARALKRTLGGNLDISPWPQWDEWFDLWKHLP